jgi:hypothetical protein
MVILFFVWEFHLRIWVNSFLFLFLQKPPMAQLLSMSVNIASEYGLPLFAAAITAGKKGS